MNLICNMENLSINSTRRGKLIGPWVEVPDIKVRPKTIKKSKEI